MEFLPNNTKNVLPTPALKKKKFEYWIFAFNLNKSDTSIIYGFNHIAYLQNCVTVESHTFFFSQLVFALGLCSIVNIPL